MMSGSLILQVAVPFPLYDTFDYLPPPGSTGAGIKVGMRVRVNFGRRQVIGVIMGLNDQSRVAQNRLKRVVEVLDSVPVLEQKLLQLLRWSSAYYHFPIGEVVSTALPKRLRQGQKAVVDGEVVWRITDPGRLIVSDQLKRAPKQLALLQLLNKSPAGLGGAVLNQLQYHWRPAMKGLSQKGLVQKTNRPCLVPDHGPADHAPQLNGQQSYVVNAVSSRLEEFTAFLLAGVTGSGKTEVYLNLADQILKKGRQVLVLVPEIGLTPQLVSRFRRRFPLPLAVLHSGLSDSQRHCAWYMAGLGEVGVVIGTRSAVFTPLARPGLIIVDEEHDASFKQQEGFRYNARDISVYRARQYGIPVLLGSATPSLESLRNVQLHRYRLLKLRERAGGASLPGFEVIDIRSRKIEDGVSKPLFEEMYRHLEADGQVLLFLNRRGFAPVLICHQCGWAVSCERCDAFMTVHVAHRSLRCHHCGAQRSRPQSCPDCGSLDLRELGAGTERLEQGLRQRFNDTSIIRIDRDTTRRRGEMQTKLEQIHRGEHRILIGTQMLSKGHDFPEVTLVGIINVDYGLYSTDFRATERMAQLIVQVAGRAGRAGKPGKVILQTHQPEHPLLQLLLSRGYEAFGEAALQDRRCADLPPYRHMALLRAEGAQPHAPQAFLEQVRSSTTKAPCKGLNILGPAPPPMERRSGMYRVHLLAIAERRGPLMELLDEWIIIFKSMRSTRKVRWSLDVDPIDLS
ncbi:MAG: primosomal protein N' [Gammaproteobacteria bacterium]|nr:primosomal protein N' [Gammaproteobacteria bacterium]